MTESIRVLMAQQEFEKLESGSVRFVLTQGMNCYKEAEDQEECDIGADYEDLLKLVRPDVLELPLNKTQIEYIRFCLNENKSSSSAMVLQVATYLNSLRQEKASAHSVQNITEEVRKEILTDTNS